MKKYLQCIGFIILFAVAILADGMTTEFGFATGIVALAAMTAVGSAAIMAGR